jgi:rubrerythrin
MAGPKRTPPPVGSPRELLAMALAIETEAARRYRGLAAAMRQRGEDQLGEVFAALAVFEEGHAHRIGRQMTEPVGEIAPERVAWDLPEGAADENDGWRRLTPYQALAVAVRNEDRAFAFYSYVAADAPSAAVRRLAEDLAKEELDHAFQLRQERRRAYHRMGVAKARPLVPATLAEFSALVADTEWHAARYHRALAANVLPEAEDAAPFIAAAEDEERCAREAAGRIGRALADEALGASPTIDDALRLLEEAFDRYADVAERAKDEGVLNEAQRMAGRVVLRLSRIHGSRRNSLLAGEGAG